MNPKCYSSWLSTFCNMKTKSVGEKKKEPSLTIVETEEEEIELWELPEIEVEEIELPEKNYSD